MISKEIWCKEASGSLGGDFQRLLRSHTRGDLHTLQRLLQLANRIHPEWEGILPWSILKDLDLSVKEVNSLEGLPSLEFTHNTMYYAHKSKEWFGEYISDLLTSSAVSMLNRLKSHSTENLSVLDNGWVRTADQNKVVQFDASHYYGIRDIIEYEDQEWYRTQLDRLSQQHIPPVSFVRMLEGEVEVWEEKFKELSDKYGPYSYEDMYRAEEQPGASSEEIGKALVRWVQ